MPHYLEMSLEFLLILETFQIDDNEHHRIEEELREIVKEKFEDPNVIDKMLRDTSRFS